MNGTTSKRTIDIHGRPMDCASATFRVALAAACIGLGVFLWPFGERGRTWWWEMDSPESKSAAWLVAVIPWIMAAILPYRSHTFLDLEGFHLATSKYYGWLLISHRRRPLSDFECIVVRHVCHPGGEGPDTFTGSVGLRPKDGGAVFWLKEFPATEDEMPREACDFAVTLQGSLPLPMTILGLEFVELGKTGCVPAEDSDASFLCPPVKPACSAPVGMDQTSSVS